MPVLRYHLNAQDQISSVNDEWLSFAEANGAGTLRPPSLLGRTLWEFIADPETRHIYQALHGRVRALGVPVRIRFRCDGPDCRRLMQLDIAAGEDQHLRYEVRTLAEVSRAPMPLLDPRRRRSAAYVTMCGWCKRVAAPPRGWLELEEAAAALPLFAESRPPQLTHGICEACSDRLHRMLDGAAAAPALELS